MDLRRDGISARIGMLHPICVSAVHSIEDNVDPLHMANCGSEVACNALHYSMH